jgi:hypothetical protein
MHVPYNCFVFVIQPWTWTDCRPPVCYLWSKVKVKSVRGHPQRRYVQYSNDLDVLTPTQVHSMTTNCTYVHPHSVLQVKLLMYAHMLQVEWQPYTRQEVVDLDVPPIVEQDKGLWRSVVPMILYYVVEHHLPNRVLRQFGRQQQWPLQAVPNLQLHE